MVALVAGLFGLIIGSFLNVVILRRGVRDIGGRSSCTACGQRLAWYDLVPVLSWVLLRGRCRYCGSGISFQYPAVEAATGVAFALIAGAGLPYGVLIASCILVAIALCIFVYDLRHTIIPDTWAAGFIAAACAIRLLTDGATLPHVYSLFLAAIIAAAPLGILWGISRGAWMGFGDVKFALGIGVLLGAMHGLFAVFFAFVLGSLVLVPCVLWEKVTHTSGAAIPAGGLTMKSEVPFGPFLIAATFIVWISALYGFNLPALVGW